MAEPETIDEQILASALENVRRVSTGNVSVEGYSLQDLIAAKKVLDAGDDAAVSLPARGMRFSQMVPPCGGGN